MNDLVIQSRSGRDVTTSLIVAQVFGKEHAKVVRDIESLYCSNQFRSANFGVSFINRELPNGGSRQDRYYEMTKDGFSFLVMGYTGEKAGQFKEAFINEFNRRESMLKSDDYILARSQEILQNRLQLAQQQLQIAQGTIEKQQEAIDTLTPPKPPTPMRCYNPPRPTPLHRSLTISDFVASTPLHAFSKSGI